MGNKRRRRVAIIGCGDMGRTHLAAWNRRADAEVIAVCDPSAASVQALATTAGVPAFADFAVALEQSGAEIASICVPVNLHRAVAEAAFRRGCHVLLEKPIAGSLEDAWAIGVAARRHARQLVVSYQYRGLFGFAELKKWLVAHPPAAPLFLRCFDIREVRPKRAMHQRSMNGGPIVDMCGHLFDLARHFFQAEPKSVYARGCIGGAARPRLAGITDPAIDTAEIMVDFDGGHVLSLFVNWGLPEGFPATTRLELVGPSFLAAADPNSLTVTTADGVRTWKSETDSAGPDGRMQDLIRSIETGTDPELSAAEATRALAVSLAALASVESGQPVNIVDQPDGESRPVSSVGGNAPPLPWIALGSVTPA